MVGVLGEEVSEYAADADDARDVGGMMDSGLCELDVALCDPILGSSLTEEVRDVSEAHGCDTVSAVAVETAWAVGTRS